MLGVIFVTLYPFWSAVAGSFSEGQAYIRNRGVTFWPVSFTIANYEVVFREPGILEAFRMTILRTLIGTATHLAVASMFAYGLSKAYIVGRKFYGTLGLITMFFSGGLIPSYLMRDWLGLIDTFPVFILPHMINFWNVIIFHAFFREIPSSISESAKIDGAGEFQIFVRLILPLSGAVFAAIALFQGVWNWNDFMVPLAFTQSRELETIPLLLMRVIRTREAAAGLAARAALVTTQHARIHPVTIQLATMVVAAAPIAAVYPFLQRYFVKGIMLGSIKG